MSGILGVLPRLVGEAAVGLTSGGNIVRFTSYQRSGVIVRLLSKSFKWRETHPTIDHGSSWCA